LRFRRSRRFKYFRTFPQEDEIVVDLMKSACGVAYPEASASIEWANVEGVPIPFASAELLWKLKQAPQPKAEIDHSCAPCSACRAINRLGTCWAMKFVHEGARRDTKEAETADLSSGAGQSGGLDERR